MIRRQSGSSEVMKSPWTLCGESYWIEFHQERWGVPGKTRLAQTNGRIIQVPQVRVCVDLCLLEESHGRLYVRSEYETSYARLCNARNTGTIPGAVITGQPDIGKSYFAAYVLLQCLANEQPVIFANNEGTVFWFDHTGVRCRLVSSMTRSGPDFSVYGDRQVWSLVDPEDIKVPIPRILTSHRFLFYVVFASPDRLRYEHLFNSLGREWFMSPCTIRELHVIVNISGMTPSSASISLEELRRLVSVAGPYPREIIRALVDAPGFQRDFSAAFRSLDIPTLHKLFIESTIYPTPATQRVLLVTRNGGVDVNDMLSDTPRVTFKSRLVADEVKKRYRRLGFPDAQELFNSCTTRGLATTVLGSILFEGFALRLLCSGDLTDLRFFSGFAPMSAADPSSKSSPRRFEYLSESSELTLHATEDRLVRLVQAVCPSTAAADLSSQPKIPNIGDMELCLYASPPMHLVPGVCYIPDAPDNPLYDAFFCVRNGDAVTLHVVQVAVSRSQAAARRGSTTSVKTLVERAKRQYGPNAQVEVKYLLLVPYREGMSVVWDMGDELAEVPGEVRVQFIQITDSDWTVDDIIRPDD